MFALFDGGVIRFTELAFAMLFSEEELINVPLLERLGIREGFVLESFVFGAKQQQQQQQQLSQHNGSSV
jgi:hypothetical protein